MAGGGRGRPHRRPRRRHHHSRHWQGWTPPLRPLRPPSKRSPPPPSPPQRFLPPLPPPPRLATARTSASATKGTITAAECPSALPYTAALMREGGWGRPESLDGREERRVRPTAPPLPPSSAHRGRGGQNRWRRGDREPPSVGFCQVCSRCAPPKCQVPSRRCHQPLQPVRAGVLRNARDVQRLQRR